MYSVSEAYKEQIEKNVRNFSHVRITFGITNTDAVSAATIADNGHLSYSDTAAIALGIGVSSPYATLEPQRWILNGGFSIADFENPTYQGFVGESLSNSTGSFTSATKPIITIVFSEYQQFAGLSFQFDDNNRNWYPNDFTVTAYKDNVEVFTNDYNVNNEYYVINDQIPVCNKIVLQFNSMNHPYARARLETLIFGVMERMTEKDITACTCSREADLLSTAYPKYDFNFTIFDSQGNYNPENPTGVWEYLEQRQPVRASIGYELDGGSIEWMPWANTYTNGDFTVNGTGVNTQVTVKSVGLINHLTQEYSEGLYYPEGRSLYDLAMDVMTYAGFGGAIDIDLSLKNIISLQPLPTEQVNTLLQLIANAGRCVLNVERGGSISITPESTAVQDFTMDFSKMLEFPETTKIPPLRYINFTYNTITVDTAKTKVVDSEEITAEEATEYTFTHDAITNQTLTVSGLTATNIKYFAYKTVATLQGTGTVSVSGYKLIYSEAVASKRYGELGQDFDTLKNELITNATDANAYIDWVASVERRRNTYTVSDRGYPELDTADTINFTSTYLNNITATQISSQIEYKGAITNKSSKYLIKEAEQ
nr:MAG TPA: hypothetical protein [Caudoviricetes sp.]